MEQKDATLDEQRVKEINSGIYCFAARKLFAALRRVNPSNKQGEYYLTDVPQILLAEGEKVDVYVHGDAREVSGINTRAELAEFENLLRRGTIRKLMIESGVTFIDPAHAYVSAEAQLGRDCVIYPDVSIEGGSVIGEGCEIRSGTRITNSHLGDGVLVKDHCVIIDSEIESDCSVGPFAHLRMNTLLEEGSVVGNFVEVKKSRLGRGSKSMHLTYLGDATIASGFTVNKNYIQKGTYKVSLLITSDKNCSDSVSRPRGARRQPSIGPWRAIRRPRSKKERRRAGSGRSGAEGCRRWRTGICTSWASPTRCTRCGTGSARRCTSLPATCG